MQTKWWKDAIVYQIYPQSFCDSNGDGIGDLNGIREKLPYLSELGINCIWISPIYQSPQDDNGYDISDYRAIDSEYGTMDDFKALLNEAHERGIRVLMDLVVNHTSDEHPWFIEARKSKENPYRDFYLWRDGKPNGEPPSDWGSHFSGSAWEYDELTEQYYLHLFTKKQPDLNWENPNVRKEIIDMIHFWSNMGVDGYRIDTVTMYSKDLDFPDMGEKNKLAIQYFNDGSKMHDYLQELYQEAFGPYNSMTVGESANVPVEKASLYVGEDRDELSMMFHFEHVLLGGKFLTWKPENITPLNLKEILTKWQDTLEKNNGWNALYFSNHDQPRQVSRFGHDTKYWKESAKMLATLTHTQKGTPFIYQGEEIGMTNVSFDVEEYRDVEILNFFREYEKEGKDIAPMLASIAATNRDNARTPMQWNDEKNAGFSQGTPWIKIAPNYKDINVQKEENDPDSILNYYRALIRLRKENDVLIHGVFEEHKKNDPAVYTYTRTTPAEQWLVLLNMTAETVDYELPTELQKEAIGVLSNAEIMPLQKTMILSPYYSAIYSFKN